MARLAFLGHGPLSLSRAWPAIPIYEMARLASLVEEGYARTARLPQALVGLAPSPIGAHPKP